MTVINIEDQKRQWLTYGVECMACHHEWQAVVHKDKMTGLECPKCGAMEGSVSPEEFIARFWYWRTSAFSNANLLDCNHTTQQVYRRYAIDLMLNLRAAGFDIAPSLSLTSPKEE